MSLTVQIVVGLVALLHLYFLVLEMFLWTRPYGRRVFGMSAEKAETTRVLAANQGLYNGFLAAGLIWGFVIDSMSITHFFLACVFVAGLYGGFTVSRKIFFVQALPAAIGLALQIMRM